MLLTLPVVRGHTTLGRWLSGESTPRTLNECLDPTTKGIALLEAFIIEPSTEFTFQYRVAVLHPLPPGTAVAATKPLGNFTSTSYFAHACSAVSNSKLHIHVYMYVPLNYSMMPYSIVLIIYMYMYHATFTSMIHALYNLKYHGLIFNFAKICSKSRI